jgi:hypothetical protein
MSQKVARGCEEPARSQITLDGVKLERCPRRLFLDHTHDINELLWYYSAYKRGQLPSPGGLLDQPALMMEAFRVIDGAMSTVEAELSKERDKPKRKKETYTVAPGTRGRGKQGEA